MNVVARIGDAKRGKSIAEVRFKELGTGSFFGDYLYQHAVPASCFLQPLHIIVDWGIFTPKSVRLYRGWAERGRPSPYDPVVILKTLLLSHLSDPSERRKEAYVKDSLSRKCVSICTAGFSTKQGRRVQDPVKVRGD